ncbi:unnamed protein product [Adineta steineri]|uniref:Uncharacterized protein n=1 Tax=Adineta steineri TaxID=433720 RepID=A0A813X6Q1_9BILA|nr:unnamed protein product [Adineta steineri]
MSDQEQAVGPAFAMALGGLFSCVAQQLRVDIEFNGEYRITHVHSKYQHEPKQLPAKNITFKLHDLNADEKRNLVFQLHVPKLNTSQNIEMTSQETTLQDEQTIGQVTVTYVEPNSRQTITTTPVSFQLIRTAQPTADQLQVNYELDIQRNRVETAREIKRAMDTNNYQQSLAILKAQVDKVKASVSSQSPFCQLLIRDLEYRYPSERAYRSSHHNTYMQHASERGTYAPTTSFSSAQYLNISQQQQVIQFQQHQQQQPSFPDVQQQQPAPSSQTN